MRTKIGFLLLLILIFINFNCNSVDHPFEEKPNPVTLLPAVPDSSIQEKGIDAIPEGNLIRIEWTAGDETTAFYEVYRAINPVGAFNKIITLEIPIQFYEDRVPRIGIRYYYYIQAVDADGVRSDPSDTLSYLLIVKAQIIGPIGSTGSVPLFAWRDLNSPQANDYIIRIMVTDTKQIIWLSQFQNSNYGLENKSIAFNADGSALIDSLMPGIGYQWRLDIIGNEKNCGSESPWTSIQIQ